MPNVDVNGQVIEFPESMSDEQIAAAIRHNPAQFAPPSVRTPSIDRREDISTIAPDAQALAYSGPEPGSPIGLMAGHRYLTNAATNAVRYPLQWLLGEEYGPETGHKAADVIATTVVPQTPTQQALAFLLPGLARAGGVAAESGLPVLTRAGEWVMSHPGFARTAVTLPVSVGGGMAEGKSTSDIVRDALVNTGAVGGSEVVANLPLGIPKGLQNAGVTALEYAKNPVGYRVSAETGDQWLGQLAAQTMQGFAWLLSSPRLTRVPGAQSRIPPVWQGAMDAAAQRLVDQNAPRTLP